MKLDRNIVDNPTGDGKYALIKIRALNAMRSGQSQNLPKKIAEALTTLEQAGVTDYGAVETESEFFVIRLRDTYAPAALFAYSKAAAPIDAEWSQEIHTLAMRSGAASPWMKTPD